MSDTAQERSPRWRWFVAAVAIILLIIGAVLISQASARAAPDQPIDFNHQLHSEAEIECLFCHPNPLRSDIAGFPSVERCVGCHRVIANDREEVQEVLAYWERGEAIPWVPVQPQPDHVLFSHQPHLRSDLGCEDCHGPVAEMSIARPVIDMDMGWCLSCHQEQPEEKVARLADCLICHK